MCESYIFRFNLLIFSLKSLQLTLTADSCPLLIVIDYDTELYAL